jgi:hypothetical protein
VNKLVNHSAALVIFVCLYVLAVLNYDLPLSAKDCQNKLRETFRRNKTVTDLRAIDLMVVKVSIVKLL